jgi:teichuronic acid biosynthesis glycosyltransferase TuaC
MRILHLTNMYPDERRPFWGMFVRSQVEALRDLGVAGEVHLVDGRSSRLNYLRGMGAVRRLAGGGAFDLIHVHYGLTGLSALAQRRLPTVLTLYGSDVNVGWQLRVSRLAARRAARTIVCSRRMAEILAAPRPPLVLPPGIDTDRFRPRDRGAARARFGCGERETVLFFPGDPARPVKDFALFEAAVERLASDAVRVFTLGGIPDGDLPHLYVAADCLVLTSRTEGSPTVIKEAIACGCPVVSVDVGDVAEQVEGHAGCHVTRTRAPEEIASRIADVLGAARPEPSAADRERLSLRTTAHRLREVYESVAGR